MVRQLHTQAAPLITATTRITEGLGSLMEPLFCHRYPALDCRQAQTNEPRVAGENRAYGEVADCRCSLPGIPWRSLAEFRQRRATGGSWSRGAGGGSRA
jgi:hypothetical protein